MSVRHLNRAVWFIAITAGLGGSSIACSKEEPSPASPASVGQDQTFHFAPPDGTEFVRIDKRSDELALVGAPLRRVESDERRWKVGIERKGDEYRVKQDLVYIALARDGQTLVQGDVPEGVSAELVINKDGNLADVQGLDKSAESLRSLIAPGKETEAEQLITPDSLAYIVSSRYKFLFGDMIGRPATTGSSWTITNPPGSLVASRTVTVTGQESCGTATCAHLQVEFRLDPKVVADMAVMMVKSRVSASGGDPSKVSVRRATYGMSGAMLLEPATMLSHGASFMEIGTIGLGEPSEKEVTVELKGKTEISYSYAGGPAASLPAAQKKSRVAAE